MNIAIAPAFDGGALDEPTPTDAREVRLFTAALHQPTDPLEVRFLHKAMAPLPSVWATSVELTDYMPEFRRAEAKGYAPFLSINPRTRRGDDAVSEVVAAFADFDGITPDDALAGIHTAGIPEPSMIVSSGGGTHAFWPFARQQSDLPAWRMLMADLARVLGSDPKVGNPERVMRLPGFSNLKYTPPRPCRIVRVDCARRFDWREIRGAVRTTVRVAPPPPRPVVIDADRVGDPVKRCLHYLEKLPPAISGACGHDAILKAAIAIVKFGISGNDGLSILADWNNAYADPPFSERELRHKWSEALRLAGHQRGAMLARGAV